ncbi:MAG: hypothetical protein AAF597_05920 [Bacteroidota bacterium]
MKLINSYFLVMLFLSLGLTGLTPLGAQVSGKGAAAESRSMVGSDYQYYDLTCNVDAWEGYFAPHQWQRNVMKIQPSAVVKVGEVSVGSFEKPMVVLGQYAEVIETWSIEIPAAGYLSFRLLPAGGQGRESLGVSINGQSIAFKRRADGLYYSPFLQAGDKFSLRIPAGNTVYHWTNMLFHTNYNAVIVRPGEVSPGRKFVPIEAALIQRVYFLSDAPGTWPVFDQDGDLSSKHDQFELRATDERFTVNYQDSLEEEEGRFFLRRTFTIREKCNRGSWLKLQRRWVELPIITE